MYEMAAYVLCLYLLWRLPMKGMKRDSFCRSDWKWFGWNQVFGCVAKAKQIYVLLNLSLLAPVRCKKMTWSEHKTYSNSGVKTKEVPRTAILRGISFRHNRQFQLWAQLLPPQLETLCYSIKTVFLSDVWNCTWLASVSDPECSTHFLGPVFHQNERCFTPGCSLHAYWSVAPLTQSLRCKAVWSRVSTNGSHSTPQKGFCFPYLFSACFVGAAVSLIKKNFLLCYKTKSSVNILILLGNRLGRTDKEPAYILAKFCLCIFRPRIKKSHPEKLNAHKPWFPLMIYSFSLLCQRALRMNVCPVPRPGADHLAACVISQRFCHFYSNWSPDLLLQFCLRTAQDSGLTLKPFNPSIFCGQFFLLFELNLISLKCTRNTYSLAVFRDRGQSQCSLFWAGESRSEGKMLHNKFHWQDDTGVGNLEVLNVTISEKCLQIKTRSDDICRNQTGNGRKGWNFDSVWLETTQSRDRFVKDTVTTAGSLIMWAEEISSWIFSWRHGPCN